VEIDDFCEFLTVKNVSFENVDFGVFDNEKLEFFLEI
jgi:hypothetical protein